MHRSPIQLAAALILALTCTACREQPAPSPLPPPAAPGSAPGASTDSAAPALPLAPPDPAPVPPSPEPAASAPGHYTIRGRIVEHGWTKSGESWEAGGSEHYTLAMFEPHPAVRQSRYGAPLRPSDSFTESDFNKYAECYVEVVVRRFKGTPYVPNDLSADPLVHDGNVVIEQRPSGVEPTVNLDGTVTPYMRGTGWSVIALRLLTPEEISEFSRSSYTLRGTLIRRDVGKGGESWDATCRDAHLLALDTTNTISPPISATIQLQPSAAVSCENLDSFTDANVEIECRYTAGLLLTPPEAGEPESQRVPGLSVNGKEVQYYKGRGFTVERIRRLDPAPPVQQQAHP